MKKSESPEKMKIVIENPKGSYKSFNIENDPLWKDYPLSGVTYPVDYGYLEGYKSEDDEDLDVFVGTGQLHGYIKIWRCDVPLETKFVTDVTEDEWNQIIEIFKPVIKEQRLFRDTAEYKAAIEKYRR